MKLQRVLTRQRGFEMPISWVLFQSKNRVVPKQHSGGERMDPRVPTCWVTR